MLLLQAEKEIRLLTQKLHVQIVNKPRSPRSGIIPLHLTPSRPSIFLVSNYLLTINVPVVYMGRYKVVLRGDYP